LQHSTNQKPTVRLRNRRMIFRIVREGLDQTPITAESSCKE
jgi:hypothetical protein